MQTLIKSSDELSTNAVENQHKQNSSKIINRTQIEGTPFHIVESDEQTFLAIGQYAIKRPNFTKEQYIQLVIDRDWDLILDLIGIAFEFKSL